MKIRRVFKSLEEMQEMIGWLKEQGWKRTQNAYWVQVWECEGVQYTMELDV